MGKETQEVGASVYSHQLAELHNQQVWNTLTALTQTLQDVGVVETPVGPQERDRETDVLILML